MFSGNTLILSDGGTHALLACAFVREELSSRGVSPSTARSGDDVSPILLPFGPLHPGDDTPPSSVDSIHRHAELFALRLMEPLPDPREDPRAGPAELEASSLLRATFLAARCGCERVFWPASGALGESLCLDRIAQITDTALLISRLVGLDTAAHGVASIHVHAPFADLTDRQVADLVLDMGLPVESCRWWGAGSREEDRWRAALSAASHAP